LDGRVAVALSFAAMTEATELPARLERRAGFGRMQEAGLVVVILLIGLILTFAGGSVEIGGKKQNNFLRADNLLGGVALGSSIFAIMAVGLTCVIVAGGIDISVGSIYALSALGVVAALQTPEEAPDPSSFRAVSIALGVGCGIGLACGLLNGAIVVGLRMHPFIVTLGTMAIFRGIGNVRVKTGHLPPMGYATPETFTKWLTWSLKDHPYVQPMPVIIMLICVAAGWFYLSLMVAGRENYAVGGNEEAALFSGIRVAWVKLRVYALSGLMAGIAGFVAAGSYGAAHTNTGAGYELTVIAAAVVGGASLTGGRGTALGAMLGAVVIKLIDNGINILNFDKDYSSIIIGISIIVAVAIDRFSEYLRQRRLTGARRI